MFKIHLALILCWQDMRTNMNYASPLIDEYCTVLSDARASEIQKSIQICLFCQNWIVSGEVLVKWCLGVFFLNMQKINMCGEKYTSIQRSSEYPLKSESTLCVTILKQLVISQCYPGSATLDFFSLRHSVYTQ